MAPTNRARRRRQKSQVLPAIIIVVLCVVALVGVGIWNASLPTDSADKPAVAEISVFTFVDTGIVYVDPESAEIIWRNADGDQESIGESPWRNPGTPLPNTLNGHPAWREGRDIVGHPDHDLVSWVETSDGRRGDLVIVEASTGEVLARTPVPAPPERYVVIASVTDDTIYFATPDPEAAIPDMPGPDIWTWSWAEGEVPIAHQVERYFNDVSAGRWALYEDQGVEFADANRQSRVSVTAPLLEAAVTDFGGAFSPNGAYWYGSGGSRIYESATGDSIELPASRKLNYGWTSSTELTMTEPFVVCSAITGQCRGPADVFPDVCAPYDLVCGEHLPVN